jgi:hypothetical protein
MIQVSGVFPMIADAVGIGNDSFRHIPETAREMILCPPVADHALFAFSVNLTWDLAGAMILPGCQDLRDKLRIEPVMLFDVSFVKLSHGFDCLLIVIDFHRICSCLR